MLDREIRIGARQRKRTGNDQWHDVTAGSAVQQFHDPRSEIAGHIADGIDRADARRCGRRTEIGCRQIPEHRQGAGKGL
jgi:hypothetical protein